MMFFNGGVHSKLKQIITALSVMAFIGLLFVGGCSLFFTSGDTFRHEVHFPEQEKLDYQTEFDVDIVRTNPKLLYHFYLVCTNSGVPTSDGQFIISRNKLIIFRNLK